jgi:ADP-ribosylglycohydrolase
MRLFLYLCKHKEEDYMGQVKMLGALIGDIIGSVYEFCNTKSTDFQLFYGRSRFTDDSVMTLAVAKWLLEDEAHTLHYLVYCMQELGRRYSFAGYGGRFVGWLFQDNPQPYDSWGNGSGMRVSPVGLYAKTLDEALALAAVTASVSHNHPEGVKGAQAIAACVYLCKEGKTKAEIKKYVEQTFDYNLSRTIAEIRPGYEFEESCQRSVPEAIIAFLEGNSFEEVLRLAISLGGDSDTIACMACAIAACMYPIPEDIAKKCNELLTDDLREIKDKFIDLVSERGNNKNKLFGWFG